MLAGPLLVSAHLLLAHLKIVVGSLTNVHPLHGMASALGSCHVEDRGRLARVIDDYVVDIVVVYDVRDVAALTLRLNPLLRVSRRRATTAHAEPLAVRVTSAFKAAIVFALLRHRILG